MTVIRDATRSDMSAVAGLYNATIPTTTAAWTEVPETLGQRQAWFAEQQAAGFPVLVADDGGEVVGFCAIGDFRDTARWPGYRFVVEHSVHVREDCWGQGVGRALVMAMIERARALGKTQIVAGVDGANEPSLEFHRRLGFREVGRMPQIGYTSGRWLDLVLLQRPTGA